MQRPCSRINEVNCSPGFYDIREEDRLQNDRYAKTLHQGMNALEKEKHEYANG